MSTTMMDAIAFTFRTMKSISKQLRLLKGQKEMNN